MRGRSVRATKPLLQYDWTVPARAQSGRWTLTLACSRAGGRRSAKAQLSVQGGAAAGGVKAIPAGVKPTQAGLSTTGDGRDPEAWLKFGSVLVSAGEWLAGAGVDVKSNGQVGCYRNCAVATGNGIAYQATELVQRLLITRGWSPRIPGDARRIYANASAQYFDKYPNAGGYVPVPGDVIVWGGGLGHVGVVETVGGGRVSWVQQNLSASGRGSAPLGFDGRLGKLGSLAPIGFLHAKANPTARAFGPYGAADGTTYIVANGTPPEGSSGSTFTFGKPGDVSIIGDWDANRTETLGLYRPDTREFFLTGATPAVTADATFTFGKSGDVPIAGDWDANGSTTVGLYRPESREFFLAGSTPPGTSDTTFTFGKSGDIPLAGDWDGNGTTTVGLYRTDTREFFLANTTPPAASGTSFAWGKPGDVPLAGDWDGNGTTTVGLYRPDTREFFLTNTLPPVGSETPFTWGKPGDVPLVGDWDGNGTTTVGLRR